ncbi:hypothetical protein BDZ45DRAFT_104623 [Acephala macrosclerotiorum]|nr:hypothetical protein BDZ45DRAFT_104623 [Acephala macrosclerotiorum]
MLRWDDVGLLHHSLSLSLPLHGPQPVLGFTCDSRLAVRVRDNFFCRAQSTSVWRFVGMCFPAPSCHALFTHLRSSMHQRYCILATSRGMGLEHSLLVANERELLAHDAERVRLFPSTANPSTRGCPAKQFRDGPARCTCTSPQHSTSAGTSSPAKEQHHYSYRIDASIQSITPNPA